MQKMMSNADKAALLDRILEFSRANGNVESDMERSIRWIEAAIYSAAATARLLKPFKNATNQ